MANVVINESDLTTIIIATGGQTEFSFDWPILDKDHIAVYRAGTKLTRGADYNIADEDLRQSAGGVITLTSGATAGVSYELRQEVPNERTTDFSNANFTYDSLNDEMDLQVQMVQQIARDLSDISDGLGQLDTAVSDAESAAEAADESATSAAASASSAATQASNAATSASNSASSASAASTSAGSAATSSSAAAAAAAEAAEVLAALSAFNVKEYGALGNGIADDLVSIQATIAAAVAAGGGRIHFPKGVYYVSGTLSIDCSNIMLTGDGAAASVIVSTFASGALVSFGNGTTIRYRNYIRDLGFNTIPARTGGAFVKFNYVLQGGLWNFWMNAPYIGVELINTTLIHVEKCSMDNPVATYGVGVLIDGGNDHNLCDLSIAGNYHRAAVEIYATSATFMENVSGIWCVNPLILQPNAAGKIIEHIFSSRCAWDTSTGHGILINAAAGTTIRRCKFVQDWTATNGGNGLVLTGSGTIEDLEFIGLRSYNNAHCGVYIEAGTNIRFLGGTISGNSTSSSGTYSGMKFVGVTGFSVIGATVGQVAGMSNSQKYGVEVTGAADNFILQGNDLRTNVTANAALSVSLSPSKIVKDNLGFVMENRGVGSFTTDVSGDFTITHGLSAAPTRVSVAVNNAPAVVITSPVASTFGATTAKVRCFNGAAGGAPLKSFTMSSVSWWADV